MSVAFLKMVPGLVIPDCCRGCGGAGPESVPLTELCVLDESGVDDGDAAAAAADGPLQDHCAASENAMLRSALLY